jgi:coenzyme F420-reducing hydrogenase alpha subunit
VNNEKVRLIGIDAPELGDKDRNKKNAVRNGLSPKTVNEYAFKAKTFAENAIERQEVRLEYDQERKDKYGRTLAYVYRVPDDFFLNAEILKKGYGFAYTRFPFKYREEFVKFEADEYIEHIAEHVEPWSYVKFPYLRKVGWKGFIDGKDSGVDNQPSTKERKAYESDRLRESGWHRRSCAAEKRPH